MLVLFHGATLPSGLSRVFFNVLGYEAVRGLEYDKFDERGSPPPHEVTIPYTRMLAGPMDFTPGSMRALGSMNWKATNDLPSSQGTVARQLAMYVMYDTSLPMLSDMPTAYEREPDALDLKPCRRPGTRRSASTAGSGSGRSWPGARGRLVDSGSDRLGAAHRPCAAHVPRDGLVGGDSLDRRSERRQRSGPTTATRVGGLGRALRLDLAPGGGRAPAPQVTPRPTVEVRRVRGGLELRIDGTQASVHRPGRALTGAVWWALASPVLLLPRDRPRRVLLLGLAAGSVARALRALDPEAEVVGVELEPEVLRVARRHFDLDGLDVELVVGDALAHLRRERRRFDLIVEDLFVGTSRSVRKPDWVQDEGYRLIRRRLRPGGYVVSNTIHETDAIARAMCGHKS
jgi:SAM-dependent methyltransferase